MLDIIFGNFPPKNYSMIISLSIIKDHSLHLFAAICLFGKLSRSPVTLLSSSTVLQFYSSLVLHVYENCHFYSILCGMLCNHGALHSHKGST